MACFECGEVFLYRQFMLTHESGTAGGRSKSEQFSIQFLGFRGF